MDCPTSHIKGGFSFVEVARPGHGWNSGGEHIIRAHAARHSRNMQRLKHMKSDRISPRVPATLLKKSDQTPHEKSNQDPVSEGVKGCVPSQKKHCKDRHQSSYRNDLMILQRRQPSDLKLSILDNRLLVHISNFYSPLGANLSDKFILWTKGVKQIIAVAFSHDFVMHAVLAWSATHLAEVSKDDSHLENALNHRVLALKGLQAGIQSFSRYNADAILCASIIVSWQSLDAYNWIIMKRGLETVKARMAASKFQSCLEYYNPRPDIEGSSAIPFNTLLTDIDVDHGVFSRQSLLIDALCSLMTLRYSITDSPALLDAVDNLIIFLQSVQHEIEDDNPMAPKDLKSLRHMLFHFPTEFIPTLHSDPAVLVLMAHLHAVVLFIEPMTDENCTAFYSLHTAPIQAFYEEMSLRAEAESRSGKIGYGYTQALRFMEFPLKAVRAFRWTFNHCEHGYDHAHSRCTNFGSNTLLGSEQMSMLQILEDFPVGLWYNFISR